jgi:hypothetical protein
MGLCSRLTSVRMGDSLWEEQLDGYYELLEGRPLAGL